MGTDDKIKNTATDLSGKVKEGAGKVTNDPDLEAEGKMDQVKSSVKDVVEDVKDVFKH